jgi:hypothetical protein
VGHRCYHTPHPAAKCACSSGKRSETQNAGTPAHATSTAIDLARSTHRCSVTPDTSALASYSSLPMKVTSYGRLASGGMGHRFSFLLHAGGNLCDWYYRGEVQAGTELATGQGG